MGPPEVVVDPFVAPAASLTMAVIPLPNAGAVKVKEPACPCWIEVGLTLALPVNEAGPTTPTDTSGGCPGVPDCTITPERLVTRSEYEVRTSGLTRIDPLLAMLTVPEPSLMVAV